jgi:arylsulfatase A-like enzyme
MMFQGLLCKTFRFAVLFLTIVSSGVLGANEAKQHPNVLFIAVDDLNDCVEGLSDYSAAKTPNISRLAERGVLFTNAHCAAPACNPSRASIMPGVKPTTSGGYFNWQDWRQCENLDHVTTLPKHFRNHGYKMLGGGKLYHAASLSNWGHEGYLDPDPWHEYFPSKSRQLPKEAMPATFPFNGSKEFYRGFFDWAPLDIADSEMADAKVVTWAENQLATEHDDPLFLAVGIYRPHIPWYTPKSWFDEYPMGDFAMPEVKDNDLDDVPTTGQAMARRHWHKWLVDNGKYQQAVQAYLASVSFADAMVGRLLDALDHGPHARNTMIVLWSDHGYHLGHKEHWEKFALWEQTTHVPLIVAPPKAAANEFQTSQQCDRPASLIDIYPTLVDLCGLETQEHLEGQSLVPFLSNPNAESTRSVVTTQGPGNHAIRSQRWRYIRYEDGAEELYDHQQDAKEFDNLADVTGLAQIKKQHASFIPNAEAKLNPAEKTTPKPPEATRK